MSEARPLQLVTKSGFVDFDSRNPLLEEDDGTVWRLEGEAAFEILLGSDVVVSARQTGPSTLQVESFRVIEE